MANTSTTVISLFLPGILFSNTYLSAKASHELEVLLESGNQAGAFVGTESLSVHAEENLDEGVVEVAGEDVTACGEVEHWKLLLGVEALVLAEEVGVRTVASVAHEPRHVTEELLLCVSCDRAAVCEELLHLHRGTLVAVDGEQVRGALAIGVGGDVLDVECLVDLDVSLLGHVTAANAGDVLTCRVGLVLDVALCFVVVDVLDEPLVVADNAVGLAAGESKNGIELHFDGWCVVARTGKYLL